MDGEIGATIESFKSLYLTHDINEQSKIAELFLIFIAETKRAQEFTKISAVIIPRIKTLLRMYEKIELVKWRVLDNGLEVSIINFDDIFEMLIYHRSTGINISFKSLLKNPAELRYLFIASVRTHGVQYGFEFADTMRKIRAAVYTKIILVPEHEEFVKLFNDTLIILLQNIAA